MSRWLLLCGALLVLLALTALEPSRAPNAGPLGAACETDGACQHRLECVDIGGVVEGQCAASCNSSASCQERFGRDSVCLGADVCARTCRLDVDCSGGARCNRWGWCERGG